MGSHRHTHIDPPPALSKIPRILATIKSKFNFKNIFSDIVGYNVKNKINIAKNRGAPLDKPLVPWFYYK